MVEDMERKGGGKWKMGNVKCEIEMEIGLGM